MALNIEDEHHEGPGHHKKIEKKWNKELFSQDEFNKLKTQVNRDKSVKIVRRGKITTKIYLEKNSEKSKPKQREKGKTLRNKMMRTAESKLAKKGNRTTRSKKAKFDRSSSIKRNNEFKLMLKDKKNLRVNFSKPKTFIEKKDEDFNLDNIKNSILKIKEKAFSAGTEGKPITEELSHTIDAEMKAYVSISSIDLENAKNKQDISMVVKAHSGLSKDITTFSLHQDENTVEITESEISNLTSKEPESHHPSSSKYNKKSKTRLNKGNKTPKIYRKEMTDFENNDQKELIIDPISHHQSLKSLKSNHCTENSSKTSSMKNNKKKNLNKSTQKKIRTVRFKDGSEHNRQNSGMEIYSKAKL